ncbi:ESX secretion-associated protein EspG [Saccharothrix australiensis]|uniref:ESAT-6 protein secretion system EspG family protein n=1 Tax=Saccharothrix australiensis TaxID=2072 RepID=A0A495VQG3_9PSEU|nr:ESX secretion-associated protein EspG [Saccharothrix australiensis]RKT51606.1 ESAT-6 protein secretion system EspG family protein [Saccharothrix australiensis]
MTAAGTVVLSTLEFDVAWEAERLSRRNVALDVPSPGVTHAERAVFVDRAWGSLEQRGLASGRRLAPELADSFALLANPHVAVDLWIWVDRRKIKGLAAAVGEAAVLAVVDGDEVWLIESRASALAEAAVSVTGEMPAGYGRSISLPNDVLRAASDEAGRDAEKLVLALERRGLPLSDAQELAGMCDGMGTRGQFGAERARPGGSPARADRVVAWHDTPSGRYLHQVRPSSDGRSWSTITPIDNARLASCVWELVQEI